MVLAEGSSLIQESYRNRTLHEDGRLDGREEVINLLLADGTITPEKADEIHHQTNTDKAQQS